MAQEIHVQGLDAFLAEVSKVGIVGVWLGLVGLTVLQHSGKRVFGLFCGGKNEEGVSWCPDCVVGKHPVMRVVLSMTEC